MTHRERYFATAAHKQPDRIPFDFHGTALTASHHDFFKKLLDYNHITADSADEA